MIPNLIAITISYVVALRGKYVVWLAGKTRDSIFSVRYGEYTIYAVTSILK